MSQLSAPLLSTARLPTPLLSARLVVQRELFRLDVSLSAAAGEVVAVLGPNAAGKPTTLRLLAGLVGLDDGKVSVAGTTWDDPARAVFLPAQRRSVGMVFQDYLLFPHLSAVDNVAFGPRSRGMSRTAAARLAHEWLDRVGLSGVASVKPARLSGGQAQRVALARALAVRPSLLLLDEPLAALDAASRQELRADLRRHLAGPDRATLLVTHDPLDAMVLADRIVVIEEGNVVQEGTATHITRYPRTDYVARLVGLNLYRGVGAGHLVKLATGVELATVEAVDGEAFVAFPPAAVALHRSPPGGSPRNTWPAAVAGVEHHGDMVRVRLDGPVAAAADVTAAAVAELGLTPGVPVWAAVKATETHAYPA